MTGHLAPARTKGAHAARVETDRAGIRTDTTHTTGVDAAEGAGHTKRRFTSKDATGAQSTGVGVEAAFQYEPNLVAVTKVLRTFQAPAVAAGHTGIERKGILGIRQPGFIVMNIRKARINTAVHIHVRCKSGTCNTGAEHSNSNQLLLHLEFSPLISGFSRPSLLMPESAHR